MAAKRHRAASPAAGGPVQVLWTGAETIHGAAISRFGVTMSRDGKTTALVRESFAQPPEVWAGPIGAWRQVTTDNRNAHPSGARQEPALEERRLHRPGLAALSPKDYDASTQVSDGGLRPRWSRGVVTPELAGHVRQCDSARQPGVFRLLSQLPRQLRPGRDVSPRANVKDFGYGDLRDILSGRGSRSLHTRPGGQHADRRRPAGATAAT